MFRINQLYAATSAIAVAITTLFPMEAGATVGLINGSRGWNTPTWRGVTENKDTTVTLTYDKESGGTGTLTATSNEQGKWTVDKPADAKKGGIVMAEAGDNKESIKITFLEPPGKGTILVADHTVSAGSIIDIGGILGSVTGTYTAITTGYDADPLSPTFGLLTGLFPALDFNLTASSSVGTVFLTLPSDVYFSVNTLGTDSFIFDIPINGAMTIGSVAGMFSIRASGTATSDTFGTESFDYSVVGTSTFGDVSGLIHSSGLQIPVPEPATLALLAIGLAGLRFSRCKQV